MVVPAACLLAASVILGWYGGGRPTTTRADGLRATSMAFTRTARMFITLEERLAPVRILRQSTLAMMNRAVHGTGRIRDTERDATAHTRWVVSSVPPSAAAGLLLGLSHDIVLLGICGLPAVLYLAPHLRMQIWTRERGTATGGEAAFFLAYVHIMQTVGVGLYRSLEMISGARGAFPAMSRDAALVCRRVVTGGTRSGSLLHYSRHHPVGIIREFVAGYVAKQSALGDVPGYTAEKARQAFAGYEAAWSRYEKGAQEVFGGIMMFAIILPMMIMLSAMIGTPDTVRTLLTAGTAISPAISVVMVAVLNQTQPATGNTLPVWWGAPAAGAAAGLASYLVWSEAGLSVSLGAVALAAANRMAGRGAITLVRSADRMLPEFLRDMTEMSRAGAGVPGMIQRQARAAPYDGPFNGIIAEVAGRLGSGGTLDAVLSSMRFPTANMRFAMFLLGVTYRTGGGTPAILDMITEFAARIHRTKEAVTRLALPALLDSLRDPVHHPGAGPGDAGDIRRVGGGGRRDPPRGRPALLADIGGRRRLVHVGDGPDGDCHVGADGGGGRQDILVYHPGHHPAGDHRGQQHRRHHAAAYDNGGAGVWGVMMTWTSSASSTTRAEMGTPPSGYRPGAASTRPSSGWWAAASPRYSSC